MCHHDNTYGGSGRANIAVDNPAKFKISLWYRICNSSVYFEFYNIVTVTYILSVIGIRDLSFGYVVTSFPITFLSWVLSA